MSNSSLQYVLVSRYLPGSIWMCVVLKAWLHVKHLTLTFFWVVRLFLLVFPSADWCFHIFLGYSFSFSWPMFLCFYDVYHFNDIIWSALLHWQLHFIAFGLFASLTMPYFLLSSFTFHVWISMKGSISSRAISTAYSLGSQSLNIFKIDISGICWK